MERMNKTHQVREWRWGGGAHVMEERGREGKRKERVECVGSELGGVGG